MITELVKIGDTTIGVVMIGTDNGEYKEIGVWISRALIRQAVKSECKDIIINGLYNDS